MIHYSPLGMFLWPQQCVLFCCQEFRHTWYFWNTIPLISAAWTIRTFAFKLVSAMLRRWIDFTHCTGWRVLFNSLSQWPVFCVSLDLWFPWWARDGFWPFLAWHFPNFSFIFYKLGIKKCLLHGSDFIYTWLWELIQFLLFHEVLSRCLPCPLNVLCCLQLKFYP